MSCLQPTEIHLAVYPNGESRNVINFERFLKLLSQEKLIYLNGLIASRLIDLNRTGENTNDR